VLDHHDGEVVLEPATWDVPGGGGDHFLDRPLHRSRAHLAVE
jgi:hypothetical protein